MIVIYETRLINPSGHSRVYIGIHKCSENSPLWSRDVPSGYIGSSAIAQVSGGHTVDTLKLGWKHVDTRILCDIADFDYSVEDRFILAAWRAFGVAPEAKAAAALHNIDLSEYSDGCVINCQTSNLTALQDPVCRQKSVETRRISGIMDRWLSISHSHEVATKSVTTRLQSGAHQKALALAHSDESRRKARATMQKSGKYKQSTVNAVALAWSDEVREKRRATRISKRTQYAISGVVKVTGDKYKCAAVIGCSAATFMNWVSGRRELPVRYGSWSFRIE